MEDETLKRTMLFDFFGDLLTDKQREYFDLYYNEDLSLSEIAEKAGISRQGVYDIIHRASISLEEMEEKTSVIRRWRENRAGLEQAGVLARELLDRLTADRNTLNNDAADSDAADLAARLLAIIEAQLII